MAKPLLTDIEDRALAMGEREYVSLKTACDVLSSWYARQVTYGELLSVTGKLSSLGLVRWRLRYGSRLYFRKRVNLNATFAEFTATATGVLQLEAPRHVV